jgi:hypothetical protein
MANGLAVGPSLVWHIGPPQLHPAPSRIMQGLVRPPQRSWAARSSAADPPAFVSTHFLGPRRRPASTGSWRLGSVGGGASAGGAGGHNSDAVACRLGQHLAEATAAAESARVREDEAVADSMVAAHARGGPFACRHKPAQPGWRGHMPGGGLAGRPGTRAGRHAPHACCLYRQQFVQFEEPSPPAHAQAARVARLAAEYRVVLLTAAATAATGGPVGGQRPATGSASCCTTPPRAGSRWQAPRGRGQEGCRGRAAAACSPQSWLPRPPGVSSSGTAVAAHPRWARLRMGACCGGNVAGAPS